MVAVQPARSADQLLSMIPNGRGFWIDRASHSLIVDAVVSLRVLIDEFLFDGMGPPPEDRWRVSTALEWAMQSTKKEWLPMVTSAQQYEGNETPVSSTSRL